MKLIHTLTVGSLALMPATAMADLITYTDPVGDQTGIVDVTGMDFNFNTATGAYTIGIYAAAANPFIGAFRININLFNVTQDEMFADTFNDFNLVVSQTTMTLTGTSAMLTGWSGTDNVVTSTLAGFGNPPGSTFFRSSVADLPFSPTCVAEDIIGIDGCSAPDIPEPGSLALLGFGLTGLGWARRRSKT